MGDNSWEKKKPTFWEHEKNSGMRDGDWKITKIFNNDWELFNLKNDRIEQNNLSKKYSKRYKSMIYNWNLWAKRVFVN
jgi:arylsulfatase